MRGADWEVRSTKGRCQARYNGLGAGSANCSHHRFEDGNHEAGLAFHWDELIRLVHTCRGNRVRSGVRSDNGVRRKRLLVGDSGQCNRRRWVCP